MKKKRIIYSVLAVVIVLVTAITWSGLYMLSYSLTPDPNRHDMDSA